MASYHIPGTRIAITPFYDAAQPLFCLTNFSRHPVTIDGITYPTTEHYFQAQKFLTNQGDNRQAFLNSVRTRGNGPMDALAIAREWTQRWTKQQWQQWDARKEAVMEMALRAKLVQHPSIRNELLNTGNSCLVEDTAQRNEAVWGWGNDGNGTNKLGKLWMKIRNEIFTQTGRNDLTVNPDNLYADVQRARRALGQQNQLVQHWPNAKLIKATKATPANPPVTDTIFRLAADIKQQLKRGQSISATSNRGVKIRYGISGQFGSFYIQGTDRHGAPIDVYVKNNAIYENNRKVTESRWADWALPIIRQKMGQSPIDAPKQPKPAQLPIKTKVSTPKPSSIKSASKPIASFNLSGYALLLGIALCGLALFVKMALPIALGIGIVGTLGGAFLFNANPNTTYSSSSSKLPISTANIKPDLALHKTVLHQAKASNLKQATATQDIDYKPVNRYR
ncbi:NADAR domain-containing protein [Candidatus Berkiella aquae]|uniref:NADAR family protein n=1 Tax=Candidatus Berkiella aquae TaxID=295108 RepID=A0A0Q9YXX0_9GAMM|nr:NADAR family protein [Candidatus Berkiella aquae]MCS5712405.1 NADAR family protein [Candidatus Berkiella aquae]